MKIHYPKTKGHSFYAIRVNNDPQYWLRTYPEHNFIIDEILEIRNLYRDNQHTDYSIYVKVIFDDMSVTITNIVVPLQHDLILFIKDTCPELLLI